MHCHVTTPSGVSTPVERQLSRADSKFHESVLNYTAEMPPLRPARALRPAAAFAATLGAAALLTVAAVDRVPALAALRPAVEAGERPPDDDHYLANDTGGHVDHHVLYFGIDATVQRRLQAAEVLFLGNSRLMFALRPDVLRPFFAARQQPYYVMGFGWREADRFPLAMIRKFDLRPKLVVVNADGFFVHGLSPWAEEVIRDTPFAARKLRWEAEAAHEARRLTHVVFPHWPSVFGLPGLGNARTFTAYRSRFDGTWAITPWPSTDVTFQPPPLDGTALGRGEIRAADAFMDELRARGARLVLTRVPTPVPMPGASPAQVARHLGVPLVTAEVPGPTSADHSHLDRASAHDWTRAFLDALTPWLDEVDDDGPTP